MDFNTTLSILTESKTISWEEYLKKNNINPDEAPYEPIRPEWEKFPIVKAIRKWEKETGKKYTHKAP